MKYVGNNDKYIHGTLRVEDFIAAHVVGRQRRKATQSGLMRVRGRTSDGSPKQPTELPAPLEGGGASIS